MPSNLARVSAFQHQASQRSKGRQRRRAQQVRARLLGQSLDAVEIYDQQPGKTRQGEWIERLIFGNAGKLAQAERAQFELFSLFRSRQKKISHEGFIVAQVGNLRRDWQ